MVKLNKVCIVCGKAYHVCPNRIQLSKYCSRGCQNSKRKPIKYTKCQFCGKRIPIYYNTRNTKKWCSSVCSLKAFHKKHPGRRKKYSKRFRAKIPKLCKSCGKDIGRGENNYQYCKECGTKRYSINQSASQRKVRELFRKYKEKRGCKLCSYNDYGGSLDFHHKFGKDRRILASDWHSKNNVWIEESKKCILLCKNCHYELHHKGRS